MNGKIGDQEGWKDKLQGQKVLNVKIKEFLMLLHTQWEIYTSSLLPIQVTFKINYSDEY